MSSAKSVRVQGGGCILKLEDIVWGTEKVGVLTRRMDSPTPTISLCVDSELLCVQTKNILLAQEIQ